MESRLIYKVSLSINNIKWLNPTIENGAWVYIGNDDEMRKEFVFNSIEEHFTDDMLYVSYTRNGSLTVKKENIELSIDGILGIYDFSIWDTQFKKVIEFHRSGVMRLGEVGI